MTVDAIEVLSRNVYGGRRQYGIVPEQHLD
jgi:hypothetical protein